MKKIYRLSYEELSLGYISKESSYLDWTYGENGECLDDTPPKNLTEALQVALRATREFNQEYGRKQKLVGVTEYDDYDTHLDYVKGLVLEDDEWVPQVF